MHKDLNCFSKFIIFSCLLFMHSCREFYDEEFDENNISVSPAQNRTYQSTLGATDVALTSLTGTSTVVVDSGSVKVDAQISGIPQNIIQPHYGFINTDCSLLSLSIPNEAGASRSYNISETLSTESLALDLQSSGAASSLNDIDLQGKSLIIKAFSNFSGIPSPTGTNVVTIACGELTVITEDSPQTPE